MDLLHITQCHPLHAFQCIKVCEIRHSGYTDHRNVNDPFSLMSVQTICQTVLIIDIHLHIRHNPYNRYRRIIFKHLYSRIQYPLIPTEFVDDQTFHHLLFFLFKQHHGACQLGKYTAAINISRQQHRCLQQLCQPHIHNIFGLQIDLCRTSGPLHHDNIILFCQ